MEYDALYAVNDEDYSPESGGYVDAAQAMPEISNQQQNPLSSPSVLPAGFVPRPPDPAVGGKAGLTKAIGWSTGLRLSRAFRQAFDGRTLVVQNMGAHPIQGPVGYSNRTDRLTYNVRALQGDNMSSNMSVADMYADPNAGAIALATLGNPNYG